MSGKPALKNILILICFALCFSMLQFSTQARAGDDIAWQELETKYTIVHFQKLDDLKTFDKKIDYSISSESDLKRLFSSSDSKTLKSKIKAKVDAIFKRAQKILDMRKSMEKVNVHLYSDKEQLQEAFYQIYKKRGKLRGWYRFKDNTVYFTVEDVHEGMLAHELAHSIIDHYLKVRPPRNTAEILARYVDSHLKRKIKRR